ncbi:MAG: HEPN domain-containing protein [Chitinophagaceae bacterium]|nr:HEPN domain-containing protein [Chitinophagaceae bacterium]
MDDKTKDYIKYKLQKAAISINEARLLHENAMHETAVSRLYYAAFYAANALLTNDGLNPKTHTGTKSLLNKEYFLPGKLDNSFAELYTMLMAKRHEADYENFAFINEQQIPEWIDKTKSFINEIGKLVGEPFVP